MIKKYFLLFLVVLNLFVFSGCTKTNKMKLVEKKDYFVREEFNGKYFDTSKRGYYVDTLNKPNAPYFYIICMGEKTSGGYRLEVARVNKVGDKTEIIVKEIVPSDGENVIMALTSPTVIVEFPKYQENIVIKNTKGEEFVKLN